MSRKVGSNRRIKVRGKQYGPFEAVLIGQRVEIAEIDGRLVVRQGSDEIGNFPLQD